MPEWKNYQIQIKYLKSFEKSIKTEFYRPSKLSELLWLAWLSSLLTSIILPSEVPFSPILLQSLDVSPSLDKMEGFFTKESLQKW